ncbi:hypothetical protein [Escherichia coli]
MNGLILTTSGAAEIEAAYQNGQTVTVRHVLLGDGGRAGIAIHAG